MHQTYCLEIGAKTVIIILLITSISTFTSSSGTYALNMAHAQETSESGTGSTGNTLHVSNSTVSGFYSSRGITIEFPEGWAGFEVSTSHRSKTVAAVARAGLANPEDVGSTNSVIFLEISRKDTVEMAPGLAPPLVNPSANASKVSCDLKSFKSILINGIFSQELVSECSVPAFGNDDNVGNGTNEHRIALLRSILTQTEDVWIALLIFGSQDAFASDQPEFDKLVRTLYVPGAVNLDIPFGSPIETTYGLNVNGTIVPVDVVTSSDITNFRVDQEEMAVSFVAEGSQSTEGITEITIGRVLEGPYVVTVNGEIWNNLDTFNQDDPRENRIQLRYEHGAKSNIVVKGTQVVPEFPYYSVIPTTLLGGSLVILIAILVLRNPGRLIR